MKKYTKALCALGLCAALALPASAYTPPHYDPTAHMNNTVVRSIDMITLPSFDGISQIAVTSSMATPDARTGGLFDVLPETSVTLAIDENGKTTVSFASREAYVLKKLVLNKTDAAYTLSVYGSNDVDQVEWTKLSAETEEYDSDTYDVYTVKNRNEYFYYRVEISCDSDLTLHTLLPYGKTLSPHDRFWSVHLF